METIAAEKPLSAKPLSQIFDPGWDIFTTDIMDEKAISTVLKNALPPQNAEHIPTLAGIKRAAKDFCEGNGVELFKAVQLLEGV